jgi:excisionase family DNA binding protein
VSFVREKYYISYIAEWQGVEEVHDNSSGATMSKPGSYSLDSPETLSVPEAGRRLGLGKNASYDAARRGELPVLRFGRKLRVPIVAFERMLTEAKPSAR